MPFGAYHFKPPTTFPVRNFSVLLMARLACFEHREAANASGDVRNKRRVPRQGYDHVTGVSQVLGVFIRHWRSEGQAQCLEEEPRKPEEMSALRRVGLPNSVSVYTQAACFRAIVPRVCPP